MRVIPTTGPWPTATVERHGAVLGEIAAALADQFSLTGPDDMHSICTIVLQAKTRRHGRDGFSARQRVFGCSERRPGSVIDGKLEGPNVLGASHGDQ